MSSKFERVPAYLLPGTTAADIVKARAELDRQRNQNPAFDLTMPFRRAAFHARLASAMPISVDMYVEFAAAIPEGYTSRFEQTVAQSAQAAQIQSEGRKKFEAAEVERKKREAAQPYQPKSLREAQERWPMGGREFNVWVDTHQHLFANGDLLN